VYPDAVKGEWMPDDVEFVDSVIDEVFAREKVDRERLFVTGASRGGLLTLVMAAKSKHTIRAAGTVITTHLQGLADEFPIKRPIDFAMIAGTADPLMPYAGGWGSFGKPKTTGDAKARSMSVDDTIGLLLKANDISGKPKGTSLGDKDPGDGCTNEVRTWTHAKTNRRVMLVKVEGGGHVVPGGGQYLPKDLIGPACKDFDHAEVMWDFFKTSGSAEKPAPNDKPTAPAKLTAESEKDLRERVASLFEATLAGETDKCLELSDPEIVKKVGKATAEKFFKDINGLMKLGKVGKDDHRIHSITPSEDGKSATVKTELRLGGKWQPPGTEIWGLVDGKWYYRETPKK
jgi:polyhydroxybutyrate depolymerase